MQSQRRLRDELRFVADFSALLTVMEQVAVSQLRRLDERLARESSVTAMLRREFFPLLPAAASRDPLLRRDGRGGRLLVAMTSDEGMVGPLHAHTIRRALERADGPTQWVLIGQRGMRFLGSGVKPAAVLPMPAEPDVEQVMQRLSRSVLARYLRDGLGEAWLIAPQFRSATRQEIAAYPLLPLPVPSTNRAVPLEDLIIEPSVGEVVNQMSLLWIEHVGVEAYWSARRAEAAARALHVESSRQELTKRAKTVRHAFFKALHERVDISVRETCVVQRQVARRLAAQAASLGARA